MLEDDIDQADLITAWLKAAGHTVNHFSSSRLFLREVLRDSYDLLVLDWIVPHMDGVEVMTRMRESSRHYTPVLFVTARDSEDDVVAALGAGADDYMVNIANERNTDSETDQSSLESTGPVRLSVGLYLAESSVDAEL